jgi:hypothetical protein
VRIRAAPTPRLFDEKETKTFNYFYYRDPLVYEGGYPYTNNKVIAYYSTWRTVGSGAFQRVRLERWPVHDLS